MGNHLYIDLISENFEFWNRKPLFQILYKDFCCAITGNVSSAIGIKIIEIQIGFVQEALA